MSQLVLARGLNSHRGFMNRLFPNFHPGVGFLVVSLVLFVGLVTVITLMSSAKQVTKGYVLNSLESVHEDLVKESEIKDMEISKVRSLRVIKDSTKVQKMVSPKQVLFIDENTAIASR